MSQPIEQAPITPSAPQTAQHAGGATVRLLLLIGCVGMLELLPVMAWLWTFAAFQTGDIALAGEPFWLLALTLAAFWAVSRLTLDGSTGARLGAAFVVGLFALAVALFIPGSPMQRSAPGDQPVAFIGLAMLVAYLGLRGMSAGHAAPFISSYERTLRLFGYGTAALVAAIVLSVAAPASAQGELVGVLSLCLPAEMLIGLLALAIAKAGLQREQARGQEPTTADEVHWLGMAGGLAAFIVGVAFIINLFVNFQNVSLALVRLGPAGVWLNDVLLWLINGFTYILYLILNGAITFLQNNHQPIQKPQIPQLCVPRPHVTPLPPLPKGKVYCVSHPNPPSLQAATILIGVVGVLFFTLLLILLIFVIREVVRALLKRYQRKDRDEVEEERESLDARALLGEQLRGLFAGRRRPARPTEEALPQGSVRWLYREALRAAASRGMDRTPSETPDEFARRLAPALGALGATRGADRRAGVESQADFAELSDAYDQARYDEREPGADERATLRSHATRLIRLLRGNGKKR
ncbi:MAG TPA: DUF4129 domain-containing protein [Ktedonobacterales bacterium]|nr:DUF4129 domain-containing protein [Ktedonobacterales bacterium]